MPRLLFPHPCLSPVDFLTKLFGAAHIRRAWVPVTWFYPPALFPKIPEIPQKMPRLLFWDPIVPKREQESEATRKRGREVTADRSDVG